MKIYKKFGTVLVVLCMISGFFVKLTVTADDISGNIVTEPAAEMEITSEQDNSEELQTEKAEKSSEAESEVFGEIPMFEAHLEYSPEGWSVKGVFNDVEADTIQPMYSTDGETYRECGQKWSRSENEWENRWNQRCLYPNEEPFINYLAKELNRFYIKLRVVREGGIAYETQTAVIERGGMQPVPEEYGMVVKFPEIVRDGRLPNGKYQMTVGEDATAEEISAFLPDTLPVEIQLYRDFNYTYYNYIGNDIVDCLVIWKPLNLPQLTAGESVIIQNAAKEIVIPAGTILNTQTGVYRLNEPVSMSQYGSTDVRLVLNVVAKGEQPAGALKEENYGLIMAFELKPTGATSIRTYTFTKGEAEWTEHLGLSWTDAVNAQPSTASSGYMVVLEREQEPYRSYWQVDEAEDAEEEPPPFFVGLEIEGGVYDGRQLVLAWPDNYELPLNLPKMGGAGGNEGNAGSDNKDNSTEGGQRPGLPQDPEDKPAPEPPKEAENKLPEPEILKEAENKLLESALLKEQEDEAVPAIAKVEIPENNVEMAVEMPNGGPDTIVAMDTAFSGYVEESVQPDLQVKPDRRISSADNRVFFTVTAGIVVLGGAGTIVSQGAMSMKIMNALRRFFIRK